MEALDLFIRMYGYPALFGGMVLEQFVPPMPGEPLLLGAGALAGNGRPSLWFAAALPPAGTGASAPVWFGVARIAGQQARECLCRLATQRHTGARGRGGTAPSNG